MDRISRVFEWLPHGRSANLSVYCLHRMCCPTSFLLRRTLVIDRLEVMPPILDIIGVESQDFPHLSTMNDWFDKVNMNV